MCVIVSFVIIRHSSCSLEATAISSIALFQNMSRGYNVLKQPLMTAILCPIHLFMQ